VYVGDFITTLGTRPANDSEKEFQEA